MIAILFIHICSKLRELGI